MSSVTAPPPSSDSKAHHLSKRKLSRTSVILISLLSFAVLLAVVLVASASWPFSKNPIVQDLGEASDSQVQIRAFHRTYFPYPGCVIEGLIFNHDPSQSTPLLTVDKVTIRGSYLALLTKHVSRITAEGLRVTIPAFGTSKPFRTTPSKITIDEIIADGAMIAFDFHSAARPPPGLRLSQLIWHFLARCNRPSRVIGAIG